MRLLTVGTLLLVLLATLAVVEAGSRKRPKDKNAIDPRDGDDDYDDDDDEDALDEDGDEEDEDVDVDEEEEEEREPPKRKRPSKRPKKPSKIPTYTACSSSSKSVCTCEGDTLRCEKVVIGDHTLDSLNVEVHKSVKSNLTRIIFEHNAIKVVRKNRIVPGRENKVEILDLSNNFISTIEEGGFDSLTTLKILNLTHNLISRLSHKWLSEELGGTLHQLNLNQNNITRILASDFKNMDQLRKLVLDNNKFLNLNNSRFGSGLKSLEELSLDYCDITYIPDNLFDNLHNLKGVSLIGNPLVVIPKAINALPNLAFMDLSETSLTEINTDEITEDHKLKELYLKNMPYLYAVREFSFFGLPNLQKVTFEGSQKLYDINEKAFHGPQKNSDEDVTEEEFDVAEIIELNLKGCAIKSLSENLLDWSKIEKLSLEGNPIACDCDNAWLLNNDKLHPFDAYTKCASPSDLKDVPVGKVIGHVCNGDVLPRSGSTSIFFAFFLLIGAVVLSAAFLIYTRRIRPTNILYRPEMPQMGYSNLTAQQNREDEEELQGDFQPRPEAPAV